ncbi:Mitogen-activated protein kinase kinase kinase 5, putative isoform 2 [Hibiscus syriacus]|uniref:mitogen-activated protein kinase kinase kinase n=1 Tax=Hibiscus syriacus TaxID=106335 RepID=A0A6A2ZDP0_HIBSY|nr:Mitogen-activated protein kinase kinase kinase 5, putative isoform 2 [Hibiscus syriacus]
MPNSRYTFGNAQQQRRLTRLRKLRHVTDDQIGLTSNHIIDRSFSLPGSPETTLARNDCKPRSLDGLQHWSSSAVPKPLPLPEVFMNQKSNVSGTSQLASPDERLAFSGRRKNADSAAKTTAKSLSNVRKGFYHDEPIEIFKNSPKPSVATTSRGVKSFFSTPASRQRSNNQDHFYSYDDADSAKSSLSRHRGFSPKNYGSVDHNLRLNVHPRSAPTTALSSPSVSPQRSKTVGPFHSDHLVLLQNNLQENAYPLPLPPGGLQPSQSPLPRSSPVSNHIIEKPITKLIVDTTSRGVTSVFSTPASPQRSNNQDHFYSYDDADSAKSSLSRRRGFSPENYWSVDHNLRLNVHPRSAPTTALSSPSISPQRSRTVGPFHSDHLVLLQNNLQENAYPLPLPPGALQPSQSPLPRPSPVSNHLIEKPITKPIVATTSRGVTSFFSTPASPQRSNNQDHFYSYDVADSAKSLLSHRRGFSLENYGSVYHNLRLNVHPRSAPTTAFSSPVSPKRSRTVGPFHSDHSEWLQNNRQVNVYPLPLPPGALPPSQSRFPQLSPVSNHLIEKPITNSMISQWKKGRLLGRGTYGSVYEATNRETGALCAMKEVDIIPDDPKSLECIKQLEQVIIQSPLLLSYVLVATRLMITFIYLEYIHPGSINKHVREHCGAITESVVRNFTRHILSGLAYLHSLNIIHRDIKGANLLVDANGVVKLADFGVAKHLTGLSYELSLKGSPHWMAPEVIKAAMQKDSSSNLALAVDIWSLGCTVIEMVNGRPPWSELEGPQAMFKVLNKTPPIPEALSPEGKDFLRCCFRRNPAERPPAAMLLEHPFLRNSADQNGSILMQAFSRLNLTDNLNSAINFPTHKTEVKSTSSGRSITKGKSAYNSETVQLGYAQTMNCAVASHHPLFSTPEVSTHTSATGLNHGSHSFSPSSHVSSNMPHAAVNNHPCAVGRTQGTKIRHI